MKIKALDLKSLRNEEHFQFHTDFSSVVGKYSADTLDVKTLFNTFLPQLAEEAEAIDVIRKTAITDDLADADDLRDTCFRGLSLTVKAALNHYTVEVKKAASNLQSVFEHYGNIARKSYDEETAAIRNLIADLQGTYAADCTTVGINLWINELEKNNNSFVDIKNKRYKEDASKTQLRMKECRTAIDTTYYSIVERINALIIVNGPASYFDFVNELNKRVDNYHILIAQRKGQHTTTAKN